MKKLIHLACALVLGSSLLPGTLIANASSSTSSTNLCVSSAGGHPQHGGSTNSLAGCPTNLPALSATNHPAACTNQPALNSTNAAAALAARAAIFYAAVVSFDANGDGVLDSSEQAALVIALTNGTAAIFGTNSLCVSNSNGATNVAAWAAALYGQIVPFDADLNDVLDATEQAALATALEADTVSLALFAPLMLPPGHSHAAAPSKVKHLYGSREPGLHFQSAQAWPAPSV